MPGRPARKPSEVDFGKPLYLAETGQEVIRIRHFATREGVHYVQIAPGGRPIAYDRCGYPHDPDFGARYRITNEPRRGQFRATNRAPE